MVNLTLEEIVKWALAIMVVGTVFYLIFIHFNPTASDMFWGKINNATGFLKFGKEKLDYDFEMPSYMEDNVETINETISILQDKNIPVEATPGEVIEQSLEFKDFHGCELTVNQDYKGDLKLMVKNVKGQIKYYKTKISYSPCIVDIETKDFEDYIRKGLDYRIKYASEHIKIVERINFKDETTFKVYKKEEDEEIYEGDYVFLEEYAFIKINENICFVGYRTS